jgi:hypothetical protein
MGKNTEIHPRRNGSSSLETSAVPNASDAFDLSLSLDYKFITVLKKNAEDVTVCNVSFRLLRFPYR